MISSYSKYDVLVVRFPFSDLRALKARPVVVVSNEFYHKNSRNDLLVMAITSKVDNKLGFEPVLQKWKECGLLKPSVLKAAIATINKELIIEKLGELKEPDIDSVNFLIISILN
ncbi:type II toxin-antitoxin system PemK/MazF family toxin [bacterium]|nr:type II toxin-antitoxin system PemK/MazF family toxin [bacterium]